MLFQLPLLQEKTSRFSKKGVVNCEESALFWHMILDKTNARSTFSGRKKRNHGLLFLQVAMRMGQKFVECLLLELQPLLEVPKRIFPKILGLLYRSSRKAWFKSPLFFEWLQKLDAYIGRTSHRDFLILTDNCSAHETAESQLYLQNIIVSFFSQI